MDVFPFNTDNTKALSASYAHDEFVSIDKTTNFSEGNLNLTSLTVLSALEDTTTNYYNKFFLTDFTTNDLGLTVNTNKSAYPKYITTTLKLRDQDKYLHCAGTNKDILTLSATAATIDENSIFEIILLDESQCAIRQYDYNSLNSTLKYITVQDVNVNTTHSTLTAGTTTYVVPVSVATGNTTSTTLDRDTQKYSYLFDEGTGRISFFKSLSGNGRPASTSWILSAANNSGGIHTLKMSELSAATDNGTTTNDTIVNDNTVFELRKTAYAPSTLGLNDTWVSYTSAVNDYSFEVNKTNVVNDLKNNKLLTSTFHNVTANNYDVDILPLKNQLTSEGKGSKTNIFSTTEDAVTHRKYNKLYTGNNQELGMNNVFVGYKTGVKEIQLHPDRLTYFHIPYTITPYSRLSVHDAKLVEAGAIAGDRPATSDKIFIRKTEKYYNELMPQTDNTWACSWLSGNNDINGTPVWVDRYYNPGRLTKTVALTSDLVQVVDDWSTAVVYLSAQDFTVFDVRSNLMFEKGTAYAYHHVGNNDSEKIINKCSYALLTDGVEDYIDSSGTKLTNTDSRYQFNKNEYGIIKQPVPDHEGTFELNFWMQCNDWTKPFGNQIFGNFIETGFGIFNEEVITPTYLIPKDTSVEVYNTDFAKIATHNIGKNIQLFKKNPSTKGYYIVDDQWTLYEYDHDGVVKNKVDLSSNVSGTTISAADIDVDDNNVYVCTTSGEGVTLTGDYNATTQACVIKYNLTNQTSEVIRVSAYQSANASTKGDALTGFKIAAPNTTSHPLFDTEPIVVAAGVKTTVNGVSAINNSFVVDNDGDPWFIANNRVWTYDRDLSATGNTVVEALSSASSIVGINVDLDNNVWVIYDQNKIAKLDKNRNLLFTTSLTATPSAYNSRNLDFVYEFNNDGYNKYVTVYNEVSGAGNIIKINSDNGDIIEEIDTTISTGKTGGVDSLSGVKSFNGFETVRRYNRNEVNKLKFKLAVTEQFNTKTSTAAYTTQTLTYTTSGLDNGRHNFHVKFNAETGEYKLYVDSLETSAISLSATKYSFLPVFDSNIVVGATPYLNNILLDNYTKQPTHHKIGNVILTNIKIYEKALSYYEIKSHYRLLSNIEPVNFDIAIGNRNYLDEIERTFKFKIPGRKSEYLNLDIRGTQVTDQTLKQDLANIVIEEMDRISPMYTKINNIDWDGTTIITDALTGRESDNASYDTTIGPNPEGSNY